MASKKLRQWSALTRTCSFLCLKLRVVTQVSAGPAAGSKVYRAVAFVFVFFPFGDGVSCVLVYIVYSLTSTHSPLAFVSQVSCLAVHTILHASIMIFFTHVKEGISRRAWVLWRKAGPWIN